MQFVTKGRPVAVVGHSVIDAYIGKDGAAHSSETIWADKLTFIKTAKSEKAAEPAVDDEANEGKEGDLPF